VGQTLSMELTVEASRKTVSAKIVPLPFFNPPRKTAAACTLSARSTAPLRRREALTPLYLQILSGGKRRYDAPLQCILRVQRLYFFSTARS